MLVRPCYYYQFLTAQAEIVSTNLVRQKKCVRDLQNNNYNVNIVIFVTIAIERFWKTAGTRIDLKLDIFV